jgi:hypothetical protein
MARYTKSSGAQGAWVDKAAVKNGTRAKIVSETEPQEGQFGKQNVCKVRFEGAPDVVNVNLNQTTINALVEAFGEDSASWQGNVLTTQVEPSVIGGKRVKVLYLIPAGYVLGEDENSYIVIRKQEPEIPVIQEDSPTAIDEKSLPF